MSANVSETSGTGDSADESLETPCSRRSKAWEHFEGDLVVVDGVPKAVCKYCALKLTCTRKSGTSSLKNDISESCPRIIDEDRNMFLATIKKKPSNVGFVFHPEKSCSLMTKYCIHVEVPFRKFEDPYFEEWMESLQPTFKITGRQTLCNECYRQYEQMKEELRIELKGLDSRLCLTSDMWSSSHKLGYMCVTAHYVDANFVLKKKNTIF